MKTVNDLKATPNWVVWRLEQAPGRSKPGKVPYVGPNKRWSNRTQLLSYDEAVSLREEHGFDGVGFRFTQTDPFAGVDFDHVRNPETGEIDEWARAIIEQLDSYTEVSPSGTGIHVIVEAEGFRGKVKTDAIEIYGQGQYFTWTGQPLNGKDEISERRAVIEALLHRYKEPAPEPEDVPEPEDTGADGISDTDLLELMMARDPKRFHRLFVAGEFARSQSEADFELCCMLARWTGKDPDRMDRLFRKSALMRDKWKRKDYRESTLKLAIIATHSVIDLSVLKGEATSLAIPAQELAENPDLLRPPVIVSPWLSWNEQLTLLVGREKFGKSTLCGTDAMVAAENGKRVLWVSAEESQGRIVSRFHQLLQTASGNALPWPPELLMLKRWPTSWEEVELTIEKERPDLVYVDSIASFLKTVEGRLPKHSEGEEWQGLVHRFKSWCEKWGLSVVALHHATKASGEYRGSTGIGAAVDIMANLREVKGKDDMRLLDLEKSRWSLENVFLKLPTDGARYEQTDELGIVKSLEQRLLDFIEANPGSSTRQIRDGVEGNNSEISGALATLVKQQKVEVTRGAKNARLYHPTQLDAVADDTEF